MGLMVYRRESNIWLVGWLLRYSVSVAIGFLFGYAAFSEGEKGEAYWRGHLDGYEKSSEHWRLFYPGLPNKEK